MSDACYMSVVCRKADVPRFEALGFNEGDETLPPGVAFMEDAEANYAHVNDMPRDIPYYGNADAGAEYPAFSFACDGKVYADFESFETRGHVITSKSLRAHREYRQALAGAVFALLGRGPAPRVPPTVFECEDYPMPSSVRDEPGACERDMLAFADGITG